jgi:membrane protease YdiL (CAAX protease family)
LDGFALRGTEVKPAEVPVDVPSIGSRDPGKSVVDETANLIYPEYQWKARDAWKCLGLVWIIGFNFGVFHDVLNRYPMSGHWLHTERGIVLWSLVSSSIYLLTAGCFARTETLATFWSAFGLNRKPSEMVWFGIAMAVGIRVVGHVLFAPHLGQGRAANEISAFHRTFGPEQYLYVLSPMLLAPFFEETVNRGFVYRAFRGSYLMPVSTLLLIAWTAVSHWTQYLRLEGALVLSLITLVQCYLREKSDSIWDCVICHAVFNASFFFRLTPITRDI